MSPTISVERFGAGDTFLVQNILPADLLEDAFERLYEEVKWCTMSHRGGEVPRLVAVEGTVDEDGSIPIYRHPADAPPPLSAFTPTVALIREHLASIPGILIDKPLNHVLVQRYRTGEDYISEHADKTVDILPGSYIINVSLGAQRTMTLRTKKAPQSSSSSPKSSTAPMLDRTTQRIPLPHNSALVLGLVTNRAWLHGIRPDRRPAALLSASELAFGRERISLTFRSIGTFLSPPPPSTQCPRPIPDESAEVLIWGLGARGKTRAEAHTVSESLAEREALLRAFGEENKSSSLEWETAYGGGFDVLHLA